MGPWVTTRPTTPTALASFKLSNRKRVAGGGLDLIDDDELNDGMASTDDFGVGDGFLYSSTLSRHHLARHCEDKEFKPS